MIDIYCLIDDLKTSYKYILSGNTLHSLRDFYVGCMRGLQEAGVKVDDGEPPFSHFSDWLARRFSKSKPSLFGRWTRYEGVWWQLLEEQFGNGESGFDAFFNLLSEFRQRTKVVVRLTSRHADAGAITSQLKIAGLEVLQFPPDVGYYLMVRYEDETTQIEGFYSKLDELKISAATQFKVILE